MIKFYVILSSILLAINGQAQAYQISTFNTVYDTLTTYDSGYMDSILAGASGASEHEFDFGFQFPFFGNTYSSIIVEAGGYAFFNEDDAYIEVFAGDFELGFPNSSLTYAPSDLRYHHTQENGHQVLIVEWHHVYNSLEGTLSDNHYVNFQLWLFENGVIDVRFGDIDLDDCSHYFPGHGFSFDNQSPTGNIYGPWVYIVNDDESESASFFDHHLTPTILYDDVDNNSVLTSIPEEGFVLRYTPSTILGTQDAFNAQNFQITSYAHQAIISGDLTNFKNYNLYAINGQLIKSNTVPMIDFKGLSNQLYIVELEKNDGTTEIHKISIIQ